MGQNRIVRIAGIRAKNVFAACYRHTVVRPGAALSDHQVIHPVLFIEVWTFRPDDVPQRTFPQSMALPRQPHRGQVQFLRPNFPIASVLLACGIRAVSHIIAAAIVVKQQAWVDTLGDVAQPIRLRPRACGVFGGHDEVSTTRNIRCYEIKCAVMVAECRRIDATGVAAAVQRQLRGARQHITDLAPVCQVAAVENRHAGEIGERRVHQIKIAPHRAD